MTANDPPRRARGRGVFQSLAAAALVAATAGIPGAQSPPASAPPQTFRAGVDVVLLDVTVLDQRRQPVHGLMATDFAIVESGQPREVLSVDEVRLPPPPSRTNAAWTREAPRDVVTNAPVEGRLVVIMFDHTIAPGFPTQAARDVANAAIDRLAPGDQAAVLFTQLNGTPTGFTADKAALRRAVASPAIGISQMTNGPEDSQCKCGLCSLELITHAAEALKDVPHRQKTLLFIGGAIAVDVTPVSGPEPSDCSIYARPATRAMFRAAQEANLVVHAIDPLGLVGPPSLTASVSGAGRGPVSPAPPKSATASHQSLQILAEQTGGRWVFHDNRPAEVVGPIFDESASYYLVAFRAATSDVSATARAVDVRVNRPGLEVHTRRSYFTPGSPAAATVAPATDARLMQAVRDGVPTTALPLRVAATSIAAGARAGETRVLAAVGVTLGQSASTHLDVLTAVSDLDGRMIGSRTQSVDIPASSAETAMGRGQCDVLSSLDLRPGRYQLRIAAFDQRSQKMGSVFANLEVPDLSAADLAMSGLLFDVTPSPPLFPIDSMPAALRTITSLRTFSTSDRVKVIARVMRKDRAGARPLAVQATLTDEQNRRTPVSTGPIAASAFQTDGTVDIALDVPASQLTAGNYLLTVSVASDGKSATSQARFTIR